MIMLSMETVLGYGLTRTVASVVEFYYILPYLWQQILLNHSLFGCKLTILSAFVK